MKNSPFSSSEYYVHGMVAMGLFDLKHTHVRSKVSLSGGRFFKLILKVRGGE